MPNEVVPISLLIDKSLYATTPQNGYKGDFKTLKYQFTTSGYIGKIFSYVTDHATGKLYFMVYVTTQDYNNFDPTYILIDPNKLNVPELPGIVAKLKQQEALEAQQNEIDKVGVFGYYLNKYLPIVVWGGLAVYGLTHINFNKNGK